MNQMKIKVKTHLTLWVVFWVGMQSAVVGANEGSIAFVGATIIDGTEAAPLIDGVVVISDGRIRSVGPRSDVDVPADAEILDVTGMTIMPGIVNAHAHVGGTVGLATGNYNLENLTRQLSLFARYGVTTVNSLGGDEEEGFDLRNGQYHQNLLRSRIMVAGDVVTGTDIDTVRQQVNKNADRGANFIKVRVDDNLGRSEKMDPKLVDALIEQAALRRLPVAVHLFYLEDAKAILKAGASFIAHSIRDLIVDDEFMDLARNEDACYVPTLTREVSTFVYGGEPAFFDDPYFLKEVDENVLETLKNPERQARMASSASAAAYEAGLDIAMSNVKILYEAGVLIAMGTDSGPPARFQGYFSHLEMQMMADAGMAAIDVIRSATAVAAECLNASDVGTLEPGKWGDLVLLRDNPLEDIGNTKSIEGVWIAGNRVPD
ncbi:MAG: amidohydrolase family protein [Pseudohongiellaceae bacterium]